MDNNKVVKVENGEKKKEHKLKNSNLLKTSQTIKEEEFSDDEEDEYDNYKARLQHLHRNDPMSFSGPYKEDAKILDDSPIVLRIIVTGASTGVGKAMALEFSKTPSKVALFLTGRDEEKLKNVVEVAANRGCKVQYQVGDFKSESDVDNIFARALEFLGEGIDVICINGAVTKVGNRLEDTKLTDVDEMFNTNVRGYFLWLRRTLPIMRKQNSGQIIIASSTLALEPMGRCAVYCASRFAIQGMITSLRQELEGTNVKICTIHPDTAEATFKLKNTSKSFNGPIRPPVEPNDVALTAKMIVDQSTSSNMEQIVMRSTKK